jgi:hypothetical protein
MTRKATTIHSAQSFGALDADEENQHHRDERQHAHDLEPSGSEMSAID